MDNFNLKKAYRKIYEQEQLDEISVETIKSASKEAGKLAGQAAALGGDPKYVKKKREQQERLYIQQAKKRLKTRTAKITKEELEILEYLVAEGYADTNENALVIMDNMSEEWREGIIEEIISEAWKPANQQKIDRQIERAKKKEDIAIYQRKDKEADRQWNRQRGMSFKKKMSELGSR
jgi:methylphosphotriester-DNA--protein-cysteine methyltransferase